LIWPSRNLPQVTIAAVAAREPARARAFAAKHGIPRIAAGYEALIEDPAIDAIYNPLPNALHAEWTLRALAAGKHVLCEKPLTSNAQEAELVARAAERSGLVCMEAFHYLYHPLSQRIVGLLQSGELGAVRRVEAWMCTPQPLFSDIRYHLDLGGGATMDTGCYAISMARHFSGEEPEVQSASAKLLRKDVDRAMEAELRFPSGATGKITCSLWSRTLLRVQARIECERGTLSVFNPVVPQVYHHLTITTRAGKRRERFDRIPTYTHQLRAFAAAVQEGRRFPTDMQNAVKNMRVIDAVYRAAGLPLRPSRLPVSMQ
jgi:predicted dehydrogenase